jgi:hypothetical protein
MYLLANDPVHRAAANDVDFRTRAARGSVCNGIVICLLLEVHVKDWISVGARSAGSVNDDVVKVV